MINHLWQSTLFAALVAVAAMALKNNHAKARHWLWLAASIKFLIPFSILLSLGTQVEVPYTAPIIMPATAVEQITTTFAPMPPVKAVPNVWPIIWLAGALLLIGRWFNGWLAIRRALKTATRLRFDAPIPVLSSESTLEPGVFGIFKPVLLLPRGITDNLSSEQLNAIIAHEVSHVRRRDNLTASLHMIVETIFWFHPLVWWIGAKLVEERERACDEAVLAEGSQPEIYAQGIVNVCKFYVASPLPCASGVSGADLRKRIEEIMTKRNPLNLTFSRKLILSAAAVIAVSIPFAIGVLRAQTLPPPPTHTYEVVTIRPADPAFQGTRIGPGPQGGLRVQNATVMELLTFAYGVRDYQFFGAPSWVKSTRIDLSFTPDKPEVEMGPNMPREQFEPMFNRQRERMQAVLRDRFALVLRAETRETDIYGLTLARGGHKLTKSTTLAMNMRTNRDRMEGTAATIDMLTNSLSSLLGRPVINETGLADVQYDFKVQWTPDSAPTEQDTNMGSIFTAIQEQLGLKLDSKRGPAPMFVIEKIEKPTEN